MLNFDREPTPSGLPMPPERWSEVMVNGGILAVRHAGDTTTPEEVEPLVFGFIDGQISLPLSAHSGSTQACKTAGELYDIKAAPGSISPDDIRPLHPNRSDALHMSVNPARAVIYIARSVE